MVARRSAAGREGGTNVASVEEKNEGKTPTGTHRAAWERLGDFTVTPRVVGISGLALAIGGLASVVALALLRLIGLFTNLFYFGKWSTALVSPSGNHLGYFSVLVPIGGALIIGFMARYGSERIRGHGIPEAIEAILINGSRVEPKVALLKPISSAISIGSGGPFGAEGPIIMTGGAFGSMIAQLFHLTSAERKTLLVAGAAAGMSATFAAPVASVLLAVELLLFEWKPRSLIPVAIASATAAVCRRYLLGFGPLFSVPEHPLFIGMKGILGCVLVGLLAGVLSALLTQSIYAAEDAFHKLPIHWMWWPAIGGLAIGLGGVVVSQALGGGLRHDWKFVAGLGDDARDSGRVAGEMVYLGGVARIGNVWRRARTVADDGRSTRRTRSGGFGGGRGRILAADQHGSGDGRHDARAPDEHYFCV